MVQRNARLLHRHVRDLLDVARLEAGGMDMRYTETDLARLARLAASDFDTLAEDRRIRYTVEARPTFGAYPSPREAGPFDRS